MGNCFGRPNKSDNFATPGQTLAPKPATNNISATYSPTPAQGRTVGQSPAGAPSSSSNNSDPRAAAAMAAEQRRKAALGKGKLGKQLDAQKSQTHNSLLADTSRETRLARNADANAETRAWN